MSEKIKTRKSFKTMKNSQIITLSSLLMVSLVIMVIWNNNNLVWHNNTNKFMEKFSHQPVNTIENTEYLYKSKKYRIILSASKENKEKLYMQSFEEKYGGLFYEPTYGAKSGDSKSLYAMTMHFISGSNDHFIIVYGYNKNLRASSYSVKSTRTNQWITEDISKKEYFFRIYTDIVYPEIKFNDTAGNDISNIFMDH